MSDRWVKRWEIEGSNGHIWIVALDKDGNYGCSCPIWKFKRRECHHILQVKNSNLEQKELFEKPKYVLANVLKPTYDAETNILSCPLVAIPDAQMMEVTICYYLIKHGYSMSEIRQLRRIPNDWTKERILDHIERHGEAQYTEYLTGVKHDAKEETIARIIN